MPKTKRKRTSKSALYILLVLLLLAVIVVGAILLNRYKLEKERQLDERLAAQSTALGIQSKLYFDGEPVEAFSREYMTNDEETKQTLTRSYDCTESDSHLAAKSANGKITFDKQPSEVLINITAPDGSAAFSGSLEEFEKYAVKDSGDYAFALTSKYKTMTEIATVKYAFTVTYDTKPEFSLSCETVPQGGTLLFTAKNVPHDADISLSVDYPYEPHLEKTEDGWRSYLPLNYKRDPGNYTATVVFNGETITLPFEITEVEYEVQNLTVSSSTTSSTVGNSTAMTTYNNTLDRLNAMTDENVYWTERFIQPCDGSITTEYGIKRYTNGASTPTRHAGIDIANSEGTPIAASNSGKVIFADWLDVSGYTVMIEHGMGLHTMYLHMKELRCKEGDMVQLGDTVGLMGMEGFATGPHLHFAVMVNEVSVSPWPVFDGSSGIYAIFGEQE